MSLKENIRKRRNELGMTLAEVGAALGTSRQTIQKYESGNVANVPLKKIEKLAAVLEISPAELMGWPEERLELFGYENIEPLPKTALRPRVGTIACGEPLLAVENIEEYDEVPLSIDCDFTLVCKGDSMINARIFDGDIVYIRRQEAVENGEIAAVLIGEEATLKRVFKSPGQVVLMPENPKYNPLVYAGETLKELRILGKAVAFHGNVR